MNMRSSSKIRGLGFLAKLMRRSLPVNRDVPVDSSAISKVSYHPKTRQLKVTFAKSGRTYAYGCVAKQTYEGLMSADSKGRFFVKEIRNTHPVMLVG